MAKDISRDTEIAQEYLEGINQAINRDNLIAEEKTKVLKDLDKQAKSLQKEIDSLQQLKSDAEVALSTTQENNKAESADMSSRKAKLQVELDILGSSIEQNGINVANMEAKYNSDIKKLCDDVLLATQQAEEQKAKIAKKVEELNNDINLKKKEGEDLITYINTQKKQIEENQKNLDGQTQLLSDLIAKQNTLDDLEAKIQSNIENIDASKEIKAELQKEIDDSKAEQEKVIKELETYKKEEAKFIQERLSLNILKDQLAEKEDYIKTKYTEAGLSYTS